MTLARLKWTAIAGLVLFALAQDVVRIQISPQIRTTPARILLAGMTVAGGVVLLGLLFQYVRRLHTQLERQNAELLALHRAAVDVYGELELETLLQKAVDAARTLIGARYGAVTVVDREGRVEAFVTSGISAEARRRLGSPPQGRGLLGVVLRAGERLRLRDISKHPLSVGFPPGHPPMRSLLAVPILCESPFLGNLYLAEKEGEAEFSVSDEETLVRFATQAAIAIDTTYLHERMRAGAVAEERLRIAHEMHDGVAQVLAFVNAKTQAIAEYVRSNRAEEAVRQLDQLSSAARETYTDVREGILALRSAGNVGKDLVQAVQDYVRQWQDQTGIAVEFHATEGIRLAPGHETQVLRIAQEALANVRKHAGASRVEIVIERRDREILLEVSDDGSGFDPGDVRRAGPDHFGLATMRERARTVGSELEIQSAPGLGTSVKMRLPAASVGAG